jgi:DNA-binding transcriptional MerR regulator
MDSHARATVAIPSRQRRRHSPRIASKSERPKWCPHLDRIEIGAGALHPTVSSTFKSTRSQASANPKDGATPAAVCDRCHSRGLRRQASTLRYWEHVGVIPVQRCPSGQRRYNIDAIRRIKFVRMAQRAGPSFDAIKALLSGHVERSPTFCELGWRGRRPVGGHRPPHQRVDGTEEDDRRLPERR